MATSEAANVAAELLREIVRRHPWGCGVIHANRPVGFTCLDRKLEAADPESRYADEFRVAILADAHTCDVCMARQALEALKPSLEERRDG